MDQPYSEADSRRQIIDGRLRLAGWDVDDPSQVIQERWIRGALRAEAQDWTGPAPPYQL